ncbi:MAG: hypothetical protein ACJASV_002553 [Pseudorhodobacter sp.]|jgi:hypothetical protein
MSLSQSFVIPGLSGQLRCGCFGLGAKLGIDGLKWRFRVSPPSFGAALQLLVGLIKVPYNLSLADHNGLRPVDWSGRSHGAGPRKHQRAPAVANGRFEWWQNNPSRLHS